MGIKPTIVHSNIYPKDTERIHFAIFFREVLSILLVYLGCYTTKNQVYVFPQYSAEMKTHLALTGSPKIQVRN